MKETWYSLYEGLQWSDHQSLPMQMSRCVFSALLQVKEDRQLNQGTGNMVGMHF